MDLQVLVLEHQRIGDDGEHVFLICLPILKKFGIKNSKVLQTIWSSSNEESCLLAAYAKDFVHKYPQQANRTQYFNISSSSPNPPENCDDDNIAACECYEVGF